MFGVISCTKKQINSVNILFSQSNYFNKTTLYIVWWSFKKVRYGFLFGLITIIGKSLNSCQSRKNTVIHTFRGIYVHMDVRQMSFDRLSWWYTRVGHRFVVIAIVSVVAVYRFRIHILEQQLNYPLWISDEVTKPWLILDLQADLGKKCETRWETTLCKGKV